MFTTALRSAFIFLTVSALLVSATPSLSLKISGPKNVNGVDNLKVIVTLVNTGDEILKLLNDPRGPLSNMPTDTFAITDASGSSPTFTGIKVKFVPGVVATSGDDSAFTVLAPGQSIGVTHDLSTTYNFTRTGEGAYSFEARNLFHYVNADNSLIPIYADVDSHSASISGKLAVSKPALYKRAKFVSCTSKQQSDLNDAAKAAQDYAAGALSYAKAHNNATDRYTTWFGAYTDSRHSTVVSHFASISGNTFSTYTFDCSCKDSGTYAYVNPNNFGYVTLCGAFWKAPLTGTDSRGGTLIHESSHFTRNAGTDDHVYGQSGCKSLAKSSPAQAIDNADSHEYFAENNPEQS